VTADQDHVGWMSDSEGGELTVVDSGERYLIVRFNIELDFLAGQCPNPVIELAGSWQGLLSEERAHT
jgi:hypothetical protein